MRCRWRMNGIVPNCHFNVSILKMAFIKCFRTGNSVLFRQNGNWLFARDVRRTVQRSRYLRTNFSVAIVFRTKDSAILNSFCLKCFVSLRPAPSTSTFKSRKRFPRFAQIHCMQDAGGSECVCVSREQETRYLHYLPDACSHYLRSVYSVHCAVHTIPTQTHAASGER